MVNKDDKLAYKIVSFLNKLINKLLSNLLIASEKLNYLKYKLEFGEKDDDIYIITYPKSGTTLMQMMLYQLTTSGEITFKHIYEVSPWLRNDAYKHFPLKALPSPRIIKTHDNYYDYTKGTKGKFIFIFRDGIDVAISLYHQKKNYGHPNLDFDNYFKSFIEQKNMNWFYFTKEWILNKNNHKILYLTYEDILENMDKNIQIISEFCNLSICKTDFPRIKERCSFEFMKTHQDKFGEQPPEPSPFIYDQFIRKGQPGEGKTYLSDEQKKTFENTFNKVLGTIKNNINKN